MVDGGLGERGAWRAARALARQFCSAVEVPPFRGIQIWPVSYTDHLLSLVFL